MNHTKVLIAFGVVAGLSLVAAAGYQAVQKSRMRAATPARVETAVPPADAEFVEGEAAGLVASVSGIRNPVKRAEAAASLEGLWVPNEGWSLEVEEVTKEVGGYAVRCYVYSGGMIGSGFWVVAAVADNEKGLVKGDRATLQGRVEKVEMVNTPPVPSYRILLKPARVLEVQKMPR